MGDSKSSRKLQVRRNRKKTTLFIFNNLTDELLNEILIRLSSNTEVTRCKLVCKHWFSLISSDYFVNAFAIHHRNDDKTLLPFTLLVMRNPTSLEYVEFLNAKSLSTRTLDLGFICTGLISLDASCGDLILLRRGKNYLDGRNYFDRDYSAMKYYYICNIVTRQWIALPPSPSGKGGMFGESVGFLYEPLDNDDRHNRYLVLRFIPCDDWYGHEGNSRFEVQVFSSDKGRWTTSLVMPPRILNYSNLDMTSMIACGRMLYTLICDGAVVNCIVAFDPFTNDPAQLLHVIDLPLEARDICCMFSKLGVCQGRLQFAHLICQQSRYPCISVWELEDFKMGEWTLVHKRIPTNQALRRRLFRVGITNGLSVLAFHPYNKDLMCFLVSNDLVVVYNLRTDKVESSTRNSLFVHPNPPRSLVPGVVPITQQWWPTPVRQSL